LGAIETPKSDIVIECKPMYQAMSNEDVYAGCNRALCWKNLGEKHNNKIWARPTQGP